MQENLSGLYRLPVIPVMVKLVLIGIIDYLFFLDKALGQAFVW